MSAIPNQTNKRPSTLRKIVIPVISTLLLTVITLLYGNRLYDFVSARLFTPSSEVVAIHNSIGLTAQGGDLFYASKPAIESNEEFNAACNSAERTAAILGCYYKRSIHIYDVTNTELAKAENVSAAHEMLHAAYERLNFIDRSNVDSMLTIEYAKLKNDSELQKLMEYYKQAEPDALTNELHSIIGTTIADLSPGLESYYERYFKDRQKLVAMNQEYNDVFASIEKQSAELSAKVDAMKTQLDADLASYASDLDQLDADISTFNTRAADGYYRTVSAFNAARQVLTGRVASLNARRSEVNARVAEYNGYVAELNKLSIRVNELNSSINGITEPEASL